jgi:uncharacterized repeat protein (TIGR03803 family)
MNAEQDRASGLGIAFLALALAVCVPSTPPSAAIVKPSDGYSVIHKLTDADGMAVRGALVQVADRLVGLAGERGPLASLNCSSSAAWSTIEHRNHCPGSLFSVRLNGSGFRVIHAFSRLDDVTNTNIDGYHPYGSPALGADGRIYGVTQVGGSPTLEPGEIGYGVVFALDPKTGDFEIVHAFASATHALDGAYPMGAVAALPGGDIAGTAKAFGAYSAGAVWRTAGGGEFRYAPMPAGVGEVYGGLTLGRDGLLHGTTSGGGAYGAGAYFTVDPATLEVAVVDSFPAFPWPAHGDDNTPIQAPTVLSDGTLVVAREFGGRYGTGIIARLSPAGIEVVAEFDDLGPIDVAPRFANATGAMPNGRIVQWADGRLYGTATYGGALGAGAIWRVRPDGSELEVLHNFEAGYPYGGLTLGSDGALYGTTFNTGQVFRFVPATGTCGSP